MAEKLSVQDLIKKIRSGVIRIEYINKQGVTVGSGTGFMSQGYLVTNSHVYCCPANIADRIKLSLQPTKDTESLVVLPDIDMGDWQAAYQNGSPQNEEDFAIVDISVLREHNLYQFDFESMDSKELGDKALILGFPFGNEYLVYHEATISSFYRSKHVRAIQLDASVNNSNSGGPLIDLHSGGVIGIITLKNTGLSKVFEELQKSFDTNIDTLNSSRKTTLLIAGVNPIDALICDQLQLKQLCIEIERSANVGIGYAFSSEYVTATLESLAPSTIEI